MTELLEALTSPWNLLWALVIFGFAPGFCLRLLVLIYPADHPRRQELIAELYAMNRIERPMFVMEQFETALFDGTKARAAARRARREAKRATGPATQVTRFSQAANLDSRCGS